MHNFFVFWKVSREPTTVPAISQAVRCLLERHDASEASIRILQVAGSGSRMGTRYAFSHRFILTHLHGAIFNFLTSAVMAVNIIYAVCGLLLRGGSRIRHSRGANPLGGGANIQICQIFPKNCMKLRKCWSVGGGGCPPWMRHWQY